MMIPITEAKASLTSLVRRADDEPVYLMRYSRPVGVILSADRYAELLDRLEDAEDARDSMLAADEETVSLDELETSIGLVKR